MVPDLPLDIYGVIAEFLAGAFAFRTLANLNVANHGIRDETTPILYETVMFDGAVDWANIGVGRTSSAQKRVLPSESSLAYTKYCFQLNRHYIGHPRDLIRLNLPNVQATMILTGQSADDSAPECDLVLHKPVSSYTLLSVIFKTPVQVFTRLSPNYFVSVVKPIGTVEEVDFGPEGRLLPSHHDWTTGPRFAGFSGEKHFSRSLGSFLEVLDVSRGLEHRNGHVARVSAHRLWFSIHPSGTPQGDYDAHFFMDVGTWKEFVETLLAAATVNPSILAARIRVTLDLDWEQPHTVNDVDDMLLLLEVRLPALELAATSGNPQQSVVANSPSSPRDGSDGDPHQDAGPLVALVSLVLSTGRFLNFTSEVVNLSQTSDHVTRPLKAEMSKERFLQLLPRGARV